MVVTRIPPSPTGHLHIGTTRTALFNYLYAKHEGGKMFFRSEDTDKERSRKEYEDEIISGLQLLGIKWENDTIWRQSERGEVYKKYLESGIERGTLYISKEPSRKDAAEMVEVVRLKNPNKAITFNDLVRGDITFDTTELGDLVVARSIDDALYHFTVVVDDYEMGVTHVLRGEDHISNTPRQILIQEALGFSRPIYAHLPLILAPDRSKLSKRHGAVALQEYLDEGFLPSAIVNYLALLGWNPGTDQEIFYTMDELVEQFSLDGIQKSGAVFDKQKFLWVNKEHLQRLSDNDYLKMLEQDFPAHLKKLPEFNEDRLRKLLPVIRERIGIRKEFTEAAEAGEYDFAFATPKLALEMLKWKNDNTEAEALPRLAKCSEILSDADFSSPDSIKEALWAYVEETGKGEVLWPLRVALTGLKRSPDPFTIAYIIGRESTLERIQAVIVKLDDRKT